MQAPLCGVHHSLMLDSDFLESFVNGFGRGLEIGAGLPELREGFSGLPEFLFGGRSDERLELLEPVTGDRNSRSKELGAGQLGTVMWLTGRMDRLGERITAVEHQIAELRERMARLEGMLDGLREAITGRRTSGDAA